MNSVFKCFSFIVMAFCIGCHETTQHLDVPSKEKSIPYDSDGSTNTLHWENDTIGKMPILSLIELGLSISPGIYTVDFTTKRTFKSDSIVVSVYASIDKKGWGKVDSVTFPYQGKIHKFQYLNLLVFSPETLLSIKDDKGINIRLDDFNFDSHPDIAIYDSEASGVKNIAEYIYIFDKSRERYFRHKILSTFSNVFADTAHKTITTFGQGGMASQIYGSATYRWDSTDLVMIRQIDQHYSDSLQLFIKTTREFVDGVWEAQIDTLTENELAR